jgi:hypothetical protein
LGELIVDIIDAVRTHINRLTETHLEEAAYELTRLVRASSPALQAGCTEEITYANFLAMAYASNPICDVLESGDQNIFLFRITSPPGGSCLGTILGNDTNASRHIGTNGTTQSNAIIGICTDAVMRALGGELLEVDPLTFRTPIPLGEPALVTIVLKARKQLTLATILVTRECDGKVVLKQANLKMTPRE